MITTHSFTYKGRVLIDDHHSFIYISRVGALIDDHHSFIYISRVGFLIDDHHSFIYILGSTF
jgi:hypothetical protein